MYECQRCGSHTCIEKAPFLICAECGFCVLPYSIACDLLEWKYRKMWEDAPDDYWFDQLVEEVKELGEAIFETKHPKEFELLQIRAICGNWLRHLQRG